MKPWDAASLSPWNAVRLIVSLTNDDGDRLAELLVDPSPVGTRELQLKSITWKATKKGRKYRRAFAAIRPARRQLEDWCSQGLVTAYGCVETSGEDRKPLESHHWDGRHLNYEENALTGDGLLLPIRSVVLSASDIRSLCAPPKEIANVAAEAVAAGASGAPEAMSSEKLAPEEKNQSIKKALLAHYAGWRSKKPYPGADKCHRLIGDILGYKIDREKFRDIYGKVIPGAGERGRRRNSQK
jgi:hypothetical protein